MYLDTVRQATIGTKIVETKKNGFHKPIEVYEKWQAWQASDISHHGEICCGIAREWITATDFSELGGASLHTGPRWLRQKFIWGASSFPIYWCEAIRKKTLDCGALAALASTIFSARGVRSYRVQMVQRFSKVSTHQWSNSWYDTNEQLRWMNDDLIYHEGCAIELDGELKIWDASAGWWVNPESKDGYGALLAVRVSSLSLSPDITFKWGEHCIKAFQWTDVN